jgi:hypothetical protein
MGLSRDSAKSQAQKVVHITPEEAAKALPTPGLRKAVPTALRGCGWFAITVDGVKTFYTKP